jgi:hypothetical protein
MADIALAAAGKMTPVSGIANGHEQYTFEAAEQINVGQVFRIDATTGKATKANATNATEAGQASLGVYNSGLYLAIDQARQAGNAVTGVKKGLIDGFELSALGYGAQVYLSNTDGSLADVTGTITTNTPLVGRVVPAPLTGTPTVQDKLLAVNFPPAT